VSEPVIRGLPVADSDVLAVKASVAERIPVTPDELTDLQV
jgi:hypothetical protein